jgi:hypothetical protein
VQALATLVRVLASVPVPLALDLQAVIVANRSPTAPGHFRLNIARSPKCAQFGVGQVQGRQ